MRNWLLVGSQRAKKRAVAITSLKHSAKLNGHDQRLYLKDVVIRLPNLKASVISSLVLHRLTPNLLTISYLKLLSVVCINLTSLIAYDSFTR